MSQISVILLAGGTGSRMHSATPKQFLPLKGKPLFRYSLDPNTNTYSTTIRSALRYQGHAGKIPYLTALWQPLQIVSWSVSTMQQDPL
jgi:CTP:molybdopterin cytidylyltransferase MocA